jgi:hypothetical protein
MKPFFSGLMMTILAAVFFTACSPDSDDTTNPSIQFTGGNTLYVKLGTPYKDSLVYFNDASGIARVWNDTSLYDPNHVGSYPVIYYAEDAYGNQSSATRYFVVRIEGTTLAGLWEGTRTEPWPGGTPQPFVDSLVEPATKSFSLSRLLPGINIKMEMKNATGDTLNIPSQVVAFTDTSQTIVRGSGIVATDGASLVVDYRFVTIFASSSDTINGRLEFLTHTNTSDTF